MEGERGRETLCYCGITEAEHNYLTLHTSIWVPLTMKVHVIILWGHKLVTVGYLDLSTTIDN